MTRDEALRILGLKPNATLKDAKTAYRTLARITHPDKDSTPGAKQRFILVQNAYDVFTNTESQAQNNQSRAEKERQDRENRERETRARQEREWTEREARERAHRERQAREAREERERRERENTERERQEQAHAEEEWRRTEEHYEDISGGRANHSSDEVFQTPNTIGHFLFLFKGRITRKSFWAYSSARILLIALMCMVSFASRSSIPVGVTSWLLFYSDICVAVKRFHDRNKPGIWYLIIFVPIIGFFWFFIELGFLKGTDGPNAYGADPTKS